MRFQRIITLPVKVDVGEPIVEDVEKSGDSVSISKPGFDETENEIKYRVREPEDFIQDSFRTIEVEGIKGVYFVIGKLTSGGADGPMVVQSVRFKKADGWNLDKAKQWIEDHEEDLKEENVENSSDNKKEEDDKTPIDNKKEDSKPETSTDTQLQTGLIVLGENEKNLKIMSMEADSNIKDLEVKGFGNGIIKEYRKKERIVYGAVYLKDKIDSQGDWMEGSEIAKMQERFMRLYSNGQSFIDYKHDFVPGAGHIVESWKIREGDFIFNDKEYIDAWAVAVKVIDDYAWEAIVNKKINAFSMAGMVDLGKTMIVEVTEEQAENEYDWIAYYNEETKQWLVNAYEIINVRLLSVSLVSRGANLEPRFPLIKSVDGVWKPTNWNNALELKSGGVASFVKNVVEDIKPTPTGDSVTNKNNSEDYTMLTKEDIQKMISDSLTSLKAEFAEMVKGSQSAKTEDNTNQTTEPATTIEKVDTDKIMKALEIVGNAVKELKETVSKHDKEFQDIEKNFANVETAFKQFTGTDVQNKDTEKTSDDEKKDETQNGDPDAIQKINDKVDGFIASMSKILNAPSGKTHSETDEQKPVTRTADDDLFENLV